MSEQNEATPQEPVNTPEPPSAPAPGGFDIGTVIAQAKQVITDPRTFYAGMAKSGGLSEPLIFALVMGVTSGIVVAILSIIGLGGFGMTGAAGLSAILFLPLGMVLVCFIGAGALFVIWKLMGSTENYETAFRCAAYSTAIIPLVSIASVIPYLGTLIRIAWGTWLMIIASETVHARPKQNTLVVFGILGAIMLWFGWGGEYAQRNVADALEAKTERLQQQFKGLEKLGVNEDGEVDPEKAGRAIGSFLRGIEEAAKAAEDEAQKSE